MYYTLNWLFDLCIDRHNHWYGRHKSNPTNYVLAIVGQASDRECTITILQRRMIESAQLYCNLMTNPSKNLIGTADMLC